MLLVAHLDGPAPAELERFTRYLQNHQDTDAALMLRANPQLVHAIDAHGASLDRLLVAYGGIRTIQTYLELGGNPNTTHLYFGTLMHQLCRLTDSGAHELIRLALANGADVNVRDSTGRTPLMHALHCNAHEHTLDLLAAHGARIDDVSAAGVTTIYAAATAHRIPRTTHTLAWLLRAGADPFADADAGDLVTLQMIEAYRQRWRVLAVCFSSSGAR